MPFLKDNYIIAKKIATLILLNKHSPEIPIEFENKFKILRLDTDYGTNKKTKQKMRTYRLYFFL